MNHVKKRCIVLLLLALVMTAMPAQAEVERSPFLDAAFSCLEKDNIFQRRYNEITGAEVESIFDLGIPYYLGGKYMDCITSRLQNSPHISAGKPQHSFTATISFHMATIPLPSGI